jgi:hypothetical protein
LIRFRRKQLERFLKTERIIKFPWMLHEWSSCMLHVICRTWTGAEFQQLARAIYYTGRLRGRRILSTAVSSSKKNGKQKQPESETDLCLNGGEQTKSQLKIAELKLQPLARSPSWILVWRRVQA